MSDDAPEDPDTPSLPRGHRLPITWLGLLLAGWVLYEVTAQPALGTALVCLKFGWDDFRTARWLRRTDPDPVRGRACFWLYAAWGLWKIAGIAFLISTVIVAGFDGFANRPVAGGNAPAADRLILATAGALFVYLVGFTFSAFATARAVWLAWRGGYRVWLHGSIRRAAAADVWPPSCFPTHAVNRLNLLLFSTAFVAFVLGSLFSVLCVTPARKVGPVVILSSWGLLLLVGLFAMLVSRTITADSPADCWPPTPVDPAPADPVGW